MRREVTATAVAREERRRWWQARAGRQADGRKGRERDGLGRLRENRERSAWSSHKQLVASAKLPRLLRRGSNARRGLTLVYTTYLIQQNGPGGRKYAQNVKDCPVRVRTMLEMERDFESLLMGFKRETSFRYLGPGSIPNSGSAVIVILSHRRHPIDDPDK